MKQMNPSDHMMKYGSVWLGIELLPQPVLGLLDTVRRDVEQCGDLLGGEVGFEVGAKPKVVGGKPGVL